MTPPTKPRARRDKGNPALSGVNGKTLWAAAAAEWLSHVLLCATLWTQPTRLLRPWDFPGKSTGVGCHFLLQCMQVKSETEVAQSRPTLCDPMDCSLPGSSVHGIFQARALECGAIAFSENNIGYFPHKQGSNISILHKKTTESHELLYSDRPTCSELFN